MAQMAKYGSFFYHVKVPIFVSIVRTLTGELALDSQNLIYCVGFEENVQKPPKKADSCKCVNIVSFWTISSYRKLIFNLIAAL